MALSMEQRRRLAVALALDGEAPEQVADVLRVSERSVWRWLRAWREGGDAGLATRPGWGRPPKLTGAQAARVLGWLDRSPCEFGFATERWTAPRLAAVMEGRLGVRMNHRYVSDWLARRRFTPQVPERRPRERDEGAVRAWVDRDWPAIKKVVARRATLVFEDETGFLLLPLVRRTLAPRGRTPVLPHRARHRGKVSAAAALTLSPSRGHVNLHYRTYPDAYVNNVAYAQFPLGLLRHVPGPVVLLHDRGNMHKGDPVRELCRDVPRLDLNMLPAYAPELNPPEHLWNFAKDKELANFVPHDVRELDAAVRQLFHRVKHDQHRLRAFFAASHLPWDGLTTFF